MCVPERPQTDAHPGLRQDPVPPLRPLDERHGPVDDDQLAVIAHLIKHGVVPGETRQRYGADGYGPSIYINDPEGNVVELKGPPS